MTFYAKDNLLRFKFRFKKLIIKMSKYSVNIKNSIPNGKPSNMLKNSELALPEYF